MFKKQWITNKIFYEKAKKVINFFGQLGSKIFQKSDVRKKPNV